MKPRLRLGQAQSQLLGSLCQECLKKKKKSNGGEESNASFQNVAEYNAVFSNRKSDGETAFLKISECVCRASLSAVLTQDFIQGKYETEPGVAL